MYPFFVSLPFSTLAVAEQVTEVQEGHEALQRGLILLAVEDHVFTELTRFLFQVPIEWQAPRRCQGHVETWPTGPSGGKPMVLTHVRKMIYILGGFSTPNS